MDSKIRDAATQRWAGKALSLSNERWLKRAHAAASNRDRSTIGCYEAGSSCKVCGPYAPCGAPLALTKFRVRQRGAGEGYAKVDKNFTPFWD
jgi:hypothetical protein